MNWVRCRICAAGQCGDARTGACAWRSECELHGLRMVLGVMRFRVLAIIHTEDLDKHIAIW